MWVSVDSTPSTLLIRPGITSARSSWLDTRTMTTRSTDPATEYTSVTPSTSAIASATSRDAVDGSVDQDDRGDHGRLLRWSGGTGSA